jgi:hypothetical protein
MKDGALLDDAIASGRAISTPDLKRLRGLFHARIDPIAAAVEGQPPEIAARLLLRRLHQSYGGTESVLLRRVVEASFEDVLERGDFNRRSATTVYRLAAAEAGLDVSAHLSGDDPRVVVRLAGGALTVDASTIDGVEGSPSPLGDLALYGELPLRSLSRRLREEERRALDQALLAGGARDEADLERMRALFHGRVDPIASSLQDASPKEAADHLLRRLHGTILRRYVASAWTVRDVLERGDFNCLSATTLFLLAAVQAGLGPNVSGERYRDHVRPLVFAEGRFHFVEATTADGFDAPDEFIVSRGRGRSTTRSAPLERMTTAELVARYYP